MARSDVNINPTVFDDRTDPSSGDSTRFERDAVTLSPEAARRRRQRNWAILLGLLGLMALFYFITLNRMTASAELAASERQDALQGADPAQPAMQFIILDDATTGDQGAAAEGNDAQVDAAEDAPAGEGDDAN